MPQISMALSPPEHWEDFEKLTLELFKIKWSDDDAQRNGREGQPQSGVDVFGLDFKTYELRGVQCKRRRQFDATGKLIAGGALGFDEITEEVKKAETFKPTLAHFIIATTALRDVNIQEQVRSLNEQRVEMKLFRIGLMFWEDFQDELHRHGVLLYWFYENVLKGAGLYNQDHHILHLIRTAFSRPALITPFHLENSGFDFQNAIAGTQEAIRTGILKDRDGNVFRSAFRYDLLQNSQWKDKIKSIYTLLHAIREYSTEACIRGEIEQRPGFIYIRDSKIAHDLNRMRGQAIILLNEVLAEADIEQVDPRLVPYAMSPLCEY